MPPCPASQFVCLFFFLIQSKTPFLEMVPLTVIDRIKCHADLPMGQCDGDIFSVKISSSQMTPACVELAKTNQDTCHTLKLLIIFSEKLFHYRLVQSVSMCALVFFAHILSYSEYRQHLMRISLENF